jgi:hypothetical protein
MNWIQCALNEWVLSASEDSASILLGFMQMDTKAASIFMGNPEGIGSMFLLNFSMLYKTTRCYNSEDHDLSTHDHDNLKNCIVKKAPIDGAI